MCLWCFLQGPMPLADFGVGSCLVVCCLFVQGNGSRLIWNLIRMEDEGRLVAARLVLGQRPERDAEMYREYSELGTCLENPPHEESMQAKTRGVQLGIKHLESWRRGC